MGNTCQRISFNGQMKGQGRRYHQQLTRLNSIIWPDQLVTLDDILAFLIKELGYLSHTVLMASPVEITVIRKRATAA